jgi:hypothetical protein
MSKKSRLKAELIAESNFSNQRLKKIGMTITASLLILLMTVGVLAQMKMLPNTSSGFFGMFATTSPPLPDPTPTPPTLSKEYLYAGSRLLAVEDVNAQ